VGPAPGGNTIVAILVHHGVQPSIHPSAFVAEGAWVIGDVVLEEQASIWFQAVLRGDINSIRIGRRSNIQDACVLHVTASLPVNVGEDVTVGHMAILHGCEIADRCLIGMSATVLDGARVGPASVVAAGAVVREGFVVPEGTLVAGVPARVMRDVTDQERSALIASAHNYIEYARSFRD
jgi:carbonic anhydrase/acetyltransferase-like protein (isoleucine patch superfamily)